MSVNVVGSSCGGCSGGGRPVYVRTARRRRAYSARRTYRRGASTRRRRAGAKRGATVGAKILREVRKYGLVPSVHAKADRHQNALQSKVDKFHVSIARALHASGSADLSGSIPMTEAYATPSSSRVNTHSGMTGKAEDAAAGVFSAQTGIHMSGKTLDKDVHAMHALGKSLFGK